MQPRLSIITLGVDDLDRSLRFYRDGLHWVPAVATGDFCLFDLGGVALALYPRELLAADAGRKPGGRGFPGVTLAQNVASPELVDRTLADACSAGGVLLAAPSQKDWGGYSGYFADPDGYPWEIAYNPHFTLGEDGRLVFGRDS